MIVLVMLLATAVSCIGIHDGSDPSGTSPTLGQELIDLMKAKDAGAITHAEHKELKAKLIEQYE
jgi:hypothetical protein